MRNRSLAVTALTSAAVAASAVAAPAETSRAADQKITSKGAGKVKLGMTATQLRAAGLIGPLRPGCELEGPGVRFAKLKAPLRGTVDFTRTKPRRAAFIHVRGGGTARGVGIGDTLADITAAFPKRKVIRATEEIFGFTRVRIPRNGGGPIEFAVRVKTKKVDSIDVPRIKICD